MKQLIAMLESQLTHWLDSGSVANDQLILVLSQVGRCLETSVTDVSEHIIEIRHWQIAARTANSADRNEAVRYLYTTIVPLLEWIEETDTVRRQLSGLRKEALYNTLPGCSIELKYLQACVRVGALSHLEMGRLNRQFTHILLTTKEGAKQYLRNYILNNL